jgi:hypothetical protein
MYQNEVLYRTSMEPLSQENSVLSQGVHCLKPVAILLNPGLHPEISLAGIAFSPYSPIFYKLPAGRTSHPLPKTLYIPDNMLRYVLDEWETEY